MAALATVTDYVNEARTLLQDKIAPYRYADDELMSALNVTLLDARRLRPDLFLGDGTTTSLSEVQSFITLDTTAVNIEQGFRLAVLLGVVGHAIARDQEDVQDARADAFLKKFRDKLLTLET
jgi:hypothetical protein